MNYGYSHSIGCIGADDGNTIIVPPVPAIAPSLALSAQIAGAAGLPDRIPISFDYSGSDVVDLYAATGSEGFAISEAALASGSGMEGAEFESHPNYMGQLLDLSLLKDDSVAELAIVLLERNNGGSSGIQRIALTDIDLTAPNLVVAEFSVAQPTTVRVVLDDTIFGSTTASEWALTGNVVVSANCIPGTAYVDITLANPLPGAPSNGTLSFNGTSLTDERGNRLAGFSNQSLTTIAQPTSSLNYLGNYNVGQAIAGSGNETIDFTGVIPSVGTYLVGMSILDPAGDSDAVINIAGAVSSATELADSGTLAAVKWFWVTAMGEGDIQIQNNGLAQIYDLQLVLYRAEGLSDSNPVTGTSTGAAGLAPASVTLSVPDGSHIAAFSVFRSRNATGYAWSNDVLEDFDTTHGGIGTHNISSASGVKTGSGNLTITATQQGGSGGDFSLAVVALGIA